MRIDRLAGHLIGVAEPVQKVAIAAALAAERRVQAWRRLEVLAVDMASRYGEAGLGLQGDFGAEPLAKLFEPGRLLLEPLDDHRRRLDHRRAMTGAPLRAPE